MSFCWLLAGSIPRLLRNFKFAKDRNTMTPVEVGSFPSVFKEGWLRLNKKIPFLSGADGVVRKRSRSLLIFVGIY